MTPEALAALVVIWVLPLYPAMTLVGPNIAGLLTAALLGSVLAAWAAEAELFFGGSFQLWLICLTLGLNVSAITLRLGRKPARTRSRRPEVVNLLFGRRPSRRWSGRAGVRTFTCYAPPLIVATALPVVLLSATYVTHDANAIWIFHARWILAGHSAYLSSLHNPAYSFSNPSYPPPYFGTTAVCMGHERSGRGGQRPPRLSLARAMMASAE